jgi:arginase family enzyme
MALSAVDPSSRRPLHLSLDIDGVDPHFAQTPIPSTPVPPVLTTPFILFFRYQNTRRHVLAKVRGGNSKYQDLQLAP